jgi:hypothetical protein
MLTQESRARSIEVRVLELTNFNATVRNLGCETKAEISTVLARIFPELVWQLPPARKAWQSEHPRQTVFDAIGLGLAYWQHETNDASVQQRDDEDRTLSV